VHGTDDATVPISQSLDYVAAATAAGGQATMVEVAGEHFAVIDPTADAWRETLAILDGIG
jgi:dipeptidyl aminopeptidase/acylaminoacyl peptidase